jgi:hypothetical protein
MKKISDFAKLFGLVGLITLIFISAVSGRAFAADKNIEVGTGHTFSDALNSFNLWFALLENTGETWKVVDVSRGAPSIKGLIDRHQELLVFSKDFKRVEPYFTDYENWMLKTKNQSAIGASGNTYLCYSSQKDIRPYSLCDSKFATNGFSLFGSAVVMVDEKAVLEAIKSSDAINIVKAAAEKRQSKLDEERLASDAEFKRKNALLIEEQQRKNAQAAEEARLRRTSNQALVKTVGQKICTDGSGSSQVYTGYVVLGKPAYQTQSNKFFLKGTTEQVAGGRILVRVSSILMQSPSGNSEYINQLNGDPTYQINQATWDEAMSWDVCN